MMPDGFRLWRTRRLRVDPYCHYCRCVLNAKTATVDHVLPRSLGGSNRQWNFVLACSPCNDARNYDMTDREEVKRLTEWHERRLAGEAIGLPKIKKPQIGLRARHHLAPRPLVVAWD